MQCFVERLRSGRIKTLHLKTISPQPYFLTFCPNRKWAMLPNLFLVMSILSWLHLFSHSLICNILFDSADPVSWTSLLGGGGGEALFLLCPTRACTTNVNIMQDWQQPYSFSYLHGAQGGGCCSPGGQVAVLTPLLPSLLPLGLRPATLMVFSCCWEFEEY